MTTPPADASIRALQAVAMIDLFASVGATAFDLTHTNIQGEKRGYRANRSVAEVRESMLPLIAAADRRKNNVIVRPRMKGATCIQLDDLDRDKAKTVAPAALLILETSPGRGPVRKRTIKHDKEFCGLCRPPSRGHQALTDTLGTSWTALWRPHSASGSQEHQAGHSHKRRSMRTSAIEKAPA